MRINNTNEFPSCTGEIILQTDRVTEIVRVPGEVSLVFGAVNVKPDGIQWEVVLVKVADDVFDVRNRLVAVTALVVTEGPVLWKRSSSYNEKIVKLFILLFFLL